MWLCLWLRLLLLLLELSEVVLLPSSLLLEPDNSPTGLKGTLAGGPSNACTCPAEALDADGVDALGSTVSPCSPQQSERLLHINVSDVVEVPLVGLKTGVQQRMSAAVVYARQICDDSVLPNGITTCTKQ